MGDARTRYEIGACLGRGGFGEVYLARRLAPGLVRTVVLKVLRTDLDPKAQSVQRLQDEGRMLARLDHPVLLRVFDMVTLQGRVALVAEHVDGQDLGDVFAGMPTRALVETIGRIADALDAAWRKPGPDGQPMRLVHRDIKPSNIRVSRHGAVTLLDFGIARADVTGRAAHTQTDFIVGTQGYMAPERYTSTESLAASDVYALGAVLLEGLTGGRLFGSLASPQILAIVLDADAHAKRVADVLARASADLPPEVAALALDCLEWRAEDRCEAAGLAARCEALVDALPGARLSQWARQRAWPPPKEFDGPLCGLVLHEGDPPGTPAPAPRRRPPGPALAALGGLAVAALAASGAAAGVAWWTWPVSEKTVAAVPSPVRSEPANVPPPVPVSEVEAAPTEALPAPIAAAPRRRAAPEPAVVAPPEPEPEPAPTARVALSGVSTAVLVGEGRRIALPADAVPPGDYTVEAAFPPSTTLKRTQTVLVAPGRWQVRCAMQNCTLEPGT